MFMPANVIIDYDNVELFEPWAVEGAELEYLILVTNQFGPHKINIYGFGIFPEKYSQPVIRGNPGFQVPGTNMSEPDKQ